MCKPEHLEPINVELPILEPLDIRYGINGRMYYTVDGIRYVVPDPENPTKSIQIGLINQIPPV